MPMIIFMPIIVVKIHYSIFMPMTNSKTKPINFKTKCSSIANFMLSITTRKICIKIFGRPIGSCSCNSGSLLFPSSVTKKRSSKKTAGAISRLSTIHLSFLPRIVSNLVFKKSPDKFSGPTSLERSFQTDLTKHFFSVGVFLLAGNSKNCIFAFFQN